MTASNDLKQPAPQGGDSEILRDHLRGMWASVAEAWGDYAEYVDTRGAAITAKMLELAVPQRGERVLELACGAGGTGLAAASLVGPGGAVVLSDVAAEMTSIAAARAKALGLDNVSTRELALEGIEQPEESYDVVLCREGLMFALDPARAMREIRRVLRPGGRVALAVWGPLAGRRVRRGQCATSHAHSPAGHPWALLPRRRGQAGPPALRRPARRRRRHRGAGAHAGRVLRRVVDEDVRTRRAARDAARHTARCRRARTA